MSTQRTLVHPKCKTKYRVGNWPDYDRLLVDRDLEGWRLRRLKLVWLAASRIG